MQGVAVDKVIRLALALSGSKGFAVTAPKRLGICFPGSFGLAGKIIPRVHRSSWCRAGDCA